MRNVSYQKSKKNGVRKSIRSKGEGNMGRPRSIGLLGVGRPEGKKS